ncbi:MAG TPA: conjugal transfer protein TraX [Candidatus Eisenbergiella merdipullorum]|uniref:Conjugal transfer protein TraX n=1 Tax=Candidatus Eisenbergiella merdipullorum TaxID=2838553 RepID=A0A9D2I2X1_9FIRM|nr:conjugal transfer protein TraX [Candidatus Eisenbergiella merdipullorum]
MKQKQNHPLSLTREGGISADFLKTVALVTMLIDHIGAGILERILIDGRVTDAALYGKIYHVDSILRIIGRISFPLFCFLLVEGYLHTRSRAKYALRLLLFALLSEIPFDLVFSGSLNPDSQNVFWTLLIGLLTIWGTDRARAIFERRRGALRAITETAGILVVAAAGMAAAWLLKTDYSWRGVLLIAVIRFLMRDRLLLAIDAPCLFLLTEFLELLTGGRSVSSSLETVLSHMTVFLSFLLILFYNGKRRRKGHRYFFYLFYPLHLLILYFLRQLLYALYL